MTRRLFALSRRLSVFSSVLSAILLSIFGLTWWFRAEHNALIFGVPLVGAAVAYGRVKGTEDLLAAAVLALGLASKDSRARSTALALGSLVPVGDLLALLSVGVSQPSLLFIHVAFIVVMGASASVFHFERGLP
jgi:hypothetical protein